MRSSLQSRKMGKSSCPHEETISFGYDSPRDYLPQEIIDLLDGKMKQSRETTEKPNITFPETKELDPDGQFQLGLDF